MDSQSTSPQSLEPDNSASTERSRSIRGANSIIERVNQQLSDCESIVHDLEHNFAVTGQDVYSFLSEMAQVASAAEQSVEPLIELETDIQVLKDEFPGYDDLLEIDDRIALHHQKGEQTTAAQIEKNHAQDLKLFRRRRNEIEKRVFIAREYRLAFLTQQRRLSMLQHSLSRHQLISKASNILTLLQNDPQLQELCKEHLTWIRTCIELPPYVSQAVHEKESIEDQILLLENDIQTLENGLQLYRQESLLLLSKIETLVRPVKT
ncbi:MAG: hypothetical protein P9L94_02355 [Candidatus Hinthialibacter antarcticus]|nr:hypothetical protein [Candidatus Hinthialibacter antarcticus]